jgi:hypothetical protein
VTLGEPIAVDQLVEHGDRRALDDRSQVCDVHGEAFTVIPPTVRALPVSRAEVAVDGVVERKFAVVEPGSET